MSEALTALKGVKFGAGIAEVAEAPLQGMITIRGDLSDEGFAGAVKSVSGLDLPGPREIAQAEGFSLSWMSPDELLLLCSYQDVADTIAKLLAALGDAHALVVNVSDARAVFDLSGPHARDVLAKLCPVDLSKDAFALGSFRRTRMAQVPAAFWMTSEESFRIVCFRSQAQYVFDLLSTATATGSEVNFH